jgi:DNA ligase 1
MLFRELVETSESVAATRSRKQKIEHLAACIARMQPEEVVIGVGYLAGLTRQGKLGLGWSAVQKWAPEGAASAATLSLHEIDAAFERIARASGTGSSTKRREEWLAMMAKATHAEQSMLVRLVIGELRQGALEGVVIDAIAKAANVAASSVRRAVMLGGSLTSAAFAAMTSGEAGLSAFRVELFRPVSPMLAQTANSPEEAMASLGAAAFEYKLDGARVQVHKHGDEVRIYSRLLNDVSAALPEAIDRVRALPFDRLILDGEAIALKSDGMPHAFQDTMRTFSKRREDPALESKMPLTPYFFDVLTIDGQDLIDAPLSDRIRALETLPKELLVPRTATDDPADVRSFYEAALEAGHEGIMGKSLDALYQAGRRGQSWVKLKLTHTFDLVVLAVEWGSGRRKGWLSNLHLGARDPATGEFVMLGKTFKGMTDQMLEWQTKHLLSIATEQGDWVVRVRPELVVEIAFNDVQRSSQYPGGVALRFARVKRHRPDKSASEANTIEDVRALLTPGSSSDET